MLIIVSIFIVKDIELIIGVHKDMTASLEIRIRRQYLYIYLMVLVVFSVGSVLALYFNYANHLQQTQAELLREANTTNVEIEGYLVDATKILDATLPNIVDSINAGTFTDEAAFRILNRGRNLFHSFISNETFMLMLYIDENGLVHASSKEVYKTPIDLSDRLYFKTLKKNPKLPFAVGNLVAARTTGLLTFHIAVPVVDSAGRFRGVIAQQLLPSDAATTLRISLDEDIPAQILVHLKDGNIAFIYPNPVAQDQIDVARCTYIDEKISADGLKSNVIEIPASKGLPQASYVAYATSHTYGLVTSVSYPKSAVLVSFLQSSRMFIAYCLLAFALLTFGIYRFYSNALSINSATLMSFSDALTGLMNRRAFDSEFPSLWKDAMRSKQPISALFMDIDHFKLLNDEHGHECGDIALIAIAQAIAKCVTRPLDLCCRWGGEEFVVVLPETDESNAILMANKMMAAVRAIYLDFPCDKHPKVTISIGIASALVGDKNKTDDLIDMADKAMYMAKQGGRDRYVVFSKPNSFPGVVS